MPYGRGGAGNIGREEQIKEQNKKLAEDVEAQRSLASSAAPPATSSSQVPDYAHSGRGGAGNWYEPKNLQATGTFSHPSDSTAIPTSSKPHVSTPWHPDNQELPVARAGRGGAGNFVWKDEEKERQREEEELRKRQQLNEKVEKDVEAGLPKPPGAVLGGVKAGRGW
ncbi:hypothetical protein BDV96DRAFT_99161 [Lophiotrema nucula]|uniref:Uncharacterized protein n=1 Tax=Lophiotrema nucula TaxID=690887 RepID=A0A6A5Z7Z0_9PLEO|nr:hypothetical protein BDV96DRAFT_99161 [Lophiotrema nucula]